MNRHRFSIVYSWLIRSSTYFFPDHPLFMRFRGFLYSFMMADCGKNLQVASTVIFNSLSGLRIGSNVYIAPNNIFIATRVDIGSDVILGPGSVYSGANHQFDGVSFRWLPSKSLGPITIGQGSWVAANCSITSGAILPCHSILAAGAVLNRAMCEEGKIYGGVPARKIGDVVNSLG